MQFGPCISEDWLLEMFRHVSDADMHLDNLITAEAEFLEQIVFEWRLVLYAVAW
jgi:hypothetical protein